MRVDSLAELPDALVRARTGSGLTQRELAGRLGLKEQQIQRYEIENYASASLSRLQEVMHALGVELQAGLELPAHEMPLTRLRQHLTLLGFNRHFIDRRLLRDAPENPSSAKVMELAERAARLFDLPVHKIFSGEAQLGDLATSARFKTAKNVAPIPLDAYTRYAESIADIVLRATQHLTPQALPGSAHEVRTEIERRVPLVAPDAEKPLAHSDALYVALQRECIRHYFWHVPFGHRRLSTTHDAWDASRLRHGSVIASVAASDGPTIPPRDARHRSRIIRPTPWTLLSTVWLPVVANAPTTSMASPRVDRLRTVRWITLLSWRVRTLARV